MISKTVTTSELAQLCQTSKRNIHRFISRNNLTVSGKIVKGKTVDYLVSGEALESILGKYKPDNSGTIPTGTA